jgi:hypothetical protein
MNEEIIFFLVYSDLNSMLAPHIASFDGLRSTRSLFKALYGAGKSDE